MEYQDYENPYAVAPAQNVSMMEQNRHESGNAVAANAGDRAVAEVKAQVLMARQFPRDPMLAANRILAECQRPTLAEAATYSFPRAKETVTGPSIRLAEVLARNWGNCTFGYEVLERTSGTGRAAGRSVIRAYAWDLETNMYVARQFEVKHYRATRSGGYAITDDRDIYELEANMASRRIRACILQMIPGDVTDAAVKACSRTASSKLAAMFADKTQRANAIAATIKAYEKRGVTQDDLEDYLNARCADWTADHMLRLKELKQSLDDNMIALGDAFPRLATNNQDTTITKEQVAELMALAAKTGRQGGINVELKKMGYAKYADVQVDKYDSVKAMIEGFMPEAAPAQKADAEG